MALASQTSGPVRRNRYMYRRRRTHPVRWIGGFAFVAFIAFIVWLLVPSSDNESTPTPAQSTDVATSTVPIQTPTPAPTRVPDQVPTRTVAPPEQTTAQVPSTQPIAPAPELATAPTAVATATPGPAITRTAEPETPAVPIPAALAVTTHTAHGAPSVEVADAIAFVQTDPISARTRLSELLFSGNLNTADRARVRQELTELNKSLFFSKRMYANDDFTRRYTIQSGDSLERIARREGLSSDWRMIQRMNQITNPNAIRVGAQLKLPVGTFHAVVLKSDFLLDLYLQNPNGRVLIATYPVGLGEFDGTPTGNFVVKPNSRLINPQWRNPRTGEFFASDDPMNPIGERWLGLQGTDPSNKDMLGYGIHGTIDPDSIGKTESMGCVRMNDGDVHVVYDALTERGSTVQIRP